MESVSPWLRLLWPPASPGLAHGCDLAEVFRPSLRGLEAALLAEGGSRRNGEKVIGESDGCLEKFPASRGSAFGEGRCGEDQIGLGDQVS